MKFAAVVLASVAMAAASASAQELNDPGSWAYEGCKKGLLDQIKQQHPQVTAVEIDGHMDRERESDRKEKLSGKATFNKGDENKHVTFECIVDREGQKVEKVKYDK